MTLFIEYANTDLRKKPEFLLKISEYLDREYLTIHEEAGHIPSSGAQPLHPDDPVIFSVPVAPGFAFFRDICKKLISDYETLKSNLKEACPTAILYHAGNIKWLHKNRIAAIKICSCEGAFYWAMNNQGCDECIHNRGGQRDFFNNALQNACFVCDWLAFRDMLSDWAAENGVLPGHHDLLEAFNQLNHTESVIRKNGSSEDYKFLSLPEDPDWLAAPQRFSQITMAVLWHDINSFLSQRRECRAKKNSPDPARLIKQCRICKKFFIASRSNATNCSDCRGKEPREVLRERQQNYRHSKDLKISKLYDRGLKYGLNHAEVKSRLEYWIEDSGQNISDVLNLPDTTIFSFE